MSQVDVSEIVFILLLKMLTLVLIFIVFEAIKNMAKDDSLALLNNHAQFKIFSIRIDHYFKELVISNNLSNKYNSGVFHHREGFPLSLAMESFLALTIECEHHVFHDYKIPVESSIEWKIENGISDGSFKHGYGVDAKYSDIDNNNCVIYYPPINGVAKK
jgi:hypothetical protein